MGKIRKLTALPAAIFLCVLFSFAMTLTVPAGQWKTGEDDPDSWWYDHLDGTWAVGWELIDGNGDGIGEWYLFDEDGWLITDYMTKEGYEVDQNGAWVVDGAVVRVRMDGSGNAGGSSSGSSSSGGGTSGGGSSSGQGASQAAADVPQGKYVMDRIIYNDGSSRNASRDASRSIECAPWGEGMIAAFRTEGSRGDLMLRYQEFQREGSGRWICRDEDGLVTRLVWNQASGTIEVSDEDLTRHYTKSY